MKKTMVYLEERQALSLSLLAKQRRASMASLLREAVDRFLQPSPPAPDVAQDPLFRLVALGRAEKVNRDSEDHDRILYDEQQ